MFGDCNDCDTKDRKIDDLETQIYDLERSVRELESDNEILEREKTEWKNEYYESVKYDQEVKRELGVEAKELAKDLSAMLDGLHSQEKLNDGETTEIQKIVDFLDKLAKGNN